MIKLNAQQETNEIIANAIKEFLLENNLSPDCRIYFNNQCYHFNSSGIHTETLKNIKPSNFFEYANDQTVSMSFEGIFYKVMNYPSHESDFDLQQKFNDLINSYGYYAQLGNDWNLTIYQ